MRMVVRWGWMGGWVLFKGWFGGGKKTLVEYGGCGSVCSAYVQENSKGISRPELRQAR